MAEAIRDGLRLGAIAADIAGDGDTALELLSVNTYDLAVLDRDIPGPSGDEIAKRIVASGSGMPILMLTAADRLDDKTTGFELGADDYLTKPFDLDELAARLRAVQRRSVGRAEPVLEHGRLTLNPATREVFLGGAPISLSAREFAVLEALLEHPGRPMSRSRLEERLYGWSGQVESNAVEVHVHSLRRKLGAELIKTLRGVGYMVPKSP